MEKWHFFYVTHTYIHLRLLYNKDLHSKQEKNWGNMTSCNQLKDSFLLFLFNLIIVYFVTEKFDLSIDIYIFMKSAFFFNSGSLEKMVETSKFSRKNKAKKFTSNNKNNNKRVRMF